MAQALTLTNLQLAMSQNNVKMKEWATNLVGNFKAFEIKWVNELPTENISTATIYMVKSTESTEENNIYNEYVYNETDGWEILGAYHACSVDLTGFYGKGEIDELLAGFYSKTEIDNMFEAVYTKTEIDEQLGGIYTKTEIDEQMADVYSKTEVDELVAGVKVTIDNYTTEEVTTMVGGLWTEA